MINDCDISYKISYLSIQGLRIVVSFIYLYNQNIFHFKITLFLFNFVRKLILLKSIWRVLSLNKVKFVDYAYILVTKHDYIFFLLVFE